MKRRSFLAALFAAPVLPVVAAARSSEPVTLQDANIGTATPLRFTIDKAELQSMVEKAVHEGQKRRTIRGV
jgi:hypothetical protein